MDTMTMLEGLAMLAVAVCLVTFSVMVTASPFSKDESCKPEDKDDE